MHVDGRSLWNHNIAYHQAVLDAAPTPCHRALDVGCGQGFLLPELADRCSEVVGIDPAKRRSPGPPTGLPTAPT